MKKFILILLAGMMSSCMVDFDDGYYRAPSDNYGYEVCRESSEPYTYEIKEDLNLYVSERDYCDYYSDGYCCEWYVEGWSANTYGPPSRYGCYEQWCNWHDTCGWEYIDAYDCSGQPW